MYLMRQIGNYGVYGAILYAGFMVFLNYPVLPRIAGNGFDMFWFAVLMVKMVLGLSLHSGISGWLAFSLPCVFVNICRLLDHHVATLRPRWLPRSSATISVSGG